MASIGSIVFDNTHIVCVSYCRFDHIFHYIYIYIYILLSIYFLLNDWYDSLNIYLPISNLMFPLLFFSFSTRCFFIVRFFHAVNHIVNIIPIYRTTLLANENNEPDFLAFCFRLPFFFLHNSLNAALLNNTRLIELQPVFLAVT